MVTTSSSLTQKTFFQSNIAVPQEPKQNNEIPFFKTILEGFSDGILILNPNGDCIHMNREGKAICQSLMEDQDLNPSVPDCLLTLCKHLVDSRQWFPNQPLVLTQTLTQAENVRIRAKVQWLEVPSTPETCLLVMLENLTQSAKTTALLESVQYNLTPREKDVWLLRRANHSYEEIASNLYIAVNTVKRHLKSIYAKRQMVLDNWVDSVM
jgi:DNA-binding CsgD family transcriptional regulator